MSVRLFCAAALVFVTAASAQVQGLAGADSPFQVRHASNLAVGDSLIIMTNTGAAGGNICVNIYTFSPDEQLASCCACVVTPNALVSLSVKFDQTSITLTPAVPGSVVVKLLATTGGACNAATPGALAAGLAAWGTTLHALPNGGSYALTETAFTPARLSAAELGRISALCGFIQSNGSGYGICRSCRLGGLGSSRQ